MAKKKKIKSPVKIRFKELANGQKSIYLDIYVDGQRRYEFLKLYINPGRDAITKIQNENTMTAAVAIQAKRVQEITNAKAGLVVEILESSMPIDKFIERYITVRQTRGVTCGHMYSLLNNIRDYQIRPTQVNKIDKRWVLAFINYLKQQEVPHTQDKQIVMQPMKDTTIALRLNALSATMSYAVSIGAISTNPCKQLDKSEKVQNKPEERCYLTIDEFNRLKETPYYHKNKVEARAFLFSCYTGLRLSDVEQLTKEHIVQDAGKCSIKKKLQKPGEWAYIPIPSKAVELLDLEHNDGGPFFSISCRSNMNKHLARWGRDAGINKHITFHTARHTFATIALTLGVDIYVVSQMLCHASISTTQIYAKVVDSRKREAADKMDLL